MEDFYKEHYDEFLTIEDAPIEDALSEEEVKYYISENFEPYEGGKIGDIVFVKKFIYSNGVIGENHLFVIVNHNDYMPIEYFGMILSSRLEKETYKYNIKIEKDKDNGLIKDSIIKTDHIYKLKEEHILKKVGQIDIKFVNLFNEKYKEYLNEKS